MSDDQTGPMDPVEPDGGADTAAEFDPGEFDDAALARDDALLDALARRQQPRAAEDDQFVVQVLGALAAEADTGPEAVAPDQADAEAPAAAVADFDRHSRHRRSRRISRAALAGGVAAVVVSIGGVAAAVTGTNPLTPIETVVESVTGGDQPEDAGPEAVELVAQAEEAAERGDLEEARSLVAECRETLEASSGPDHDALVARVDRLSERLATASPSPSDSGTPSPTSPSPFGTESPSSSESPTTPTSSPTSPSTGNPTTPPGSSTSPSGGSSPSPEPSTSASESAPAAVDDGASEDQGEDS